MKKSLFFSLVLFCVQIPSFAQTDAAAKYANIISTDALKKHLTIIAGDEMAGRETGTEGQRKAAAYIEEQFKLIGLKTAAGMKGYQQYFPLFQDSMLNSGVAIGKQFGEYGKDFIIPINSNETGVFKGNKIVFAGYGIEDEKYNDYAGLNVKGKIVVFFLGEPKADGKYIINGKTTGGKWTYPGLSKKIALAKSKGAAGAFVINPAETSFKLRAINDSKKSTIVFRSIMTDEKTLNFAMISQSYAKILLGNTFDSVLPMAVNKKPFESKWLVQIKNKVSYSYEKKRNFTNASNVLGIIEGTDKKDEYVFLTGHYDHLGMHDGKIYHGADDDGSGTVAVIQMAAAFAAAAEQGYRPRRTIVFMTVSGEEKGLWGSEYYSDHPVYPLAKTTVDLNTDMVGRIDPNRTIGDSMNYVYVIGHDKLSTDLPVINEGVNNKYTKLEFDYKFDDPNDQERIFYRSDHYNFARKGVPILFFFDGIHKDYHKPSDTVDKINWDLYAKRVQMIFHTAWEIANRNEMLKRDLALPEEGR